MKCPHAKRSTVLIFDKEGNAFCVSCYSGPRDHNVYTGRKIWAGRDAYGAKKCRQMNMDWFEKTKEKAERMRRTAHHSRFMR
jgi:hypothetical protein